MNIAYLIRESKEQVVSPCYFELAEQLEKDGHSLTVFNETGSFGKMGCEKVETRKTADYPTGAFNRFRYSRAVAESLKGKNFDLIFSSLPEGIYHLDSVKAPKAVMVQDDFYRRMKHTPLAAGFKRSPLGLPFPMQTKFGVMLDLRAQRKSLRKADGVVFHNKQEFNKRGKKLKAKTAFIPNGISPEKISFSPRAVKELRDFYGKPIALFMSRIELQKNPFFALEVAEKLVQKQDSVFLFAGAGNLGERLEKRIEKKGLQKNVRVLGWLEGKERLNLLKASDVYLLPSLFESSPVSLLEAMVMEKACVVSDVPGNRDLVEGNAGIALKGVDSGKWAETVSGLIEGGAKRKEIEKNAKKKVFGSLTWEKIASRYTEFFGELVKK